MKAKVNKDVCIGCEEEKEDVIDASESCPTEAIEVEE